MLPQLPQTATEYSISNFNFQNSIQYNAPVKTIRLPINFSIKYGEFMQYLLMEEKCISLLRMNATNKLISFILAASHFCCTVRFEIE